MKETSNVNGILVISFHVHFFVNLPLSRSAFATDSCTVLDAMYR
eukprot:COSAG02_NODE_505_length_20935_cov_38.509119_14_plen_44_part_00